MKHFCISVNVTFHFLLQPTTGKSKWLGLNRTLLAASCHKQEGLLVSWAKWYKKINDSVMNRRRKNKEKRKQISCSFKANFGWLECFSNLSISLCPKLRRRLHNLAHNEIERLMNHPKLLGEVYLFLLFDIV